MNTAFIRPIGSKNGDLSLSGVALVLAGWALWSMDPIMAYSVGADVPRKLLVAATSLFCSLSLSVFTFRVLRRIRTIPVRYLCLLVAQAMFFSSLASLAYMSAIRYINPGIVSVILRTQIAFAVVWAVLFLGERMNRISASGIVLIFVANVVMLVLALSAAGDGSATGWLLAFVAALLWSGATVSSKVLLSVFSPTELTGLRMLVAGVFMGLLFLGMDGPAALAEVSGRQWALMALQGVVTSGGAYVLYFSGLRRVPVYVASGLEPFAPLFTLAAAYFFLGKGVSRGDLWGTAVLLCGTVIIVAGNVTAVRKRPLRPVAPARIGPSLPISRPIVEMQDGNAMNCSGRPPL